MGTMYPTPGTQGARRAALLLLVAVALLLGNDVNASDSDDITEMSCGAIVGEMVELVFVAKRMVRRESVDGAEADSVASPGILFPRAFLDAFLPQETAERAREMHKRFFRLEVGFDERRCPLGMLHQLKTIP